MAGGEKSRGWRRVGRHYLLLLWKNVVLAKRTPFRTFLEITLPVFFGFLLLAIRHIVKSDTYTDITVYPPFSVAEFPNYTIPLSLIGYAPTTNFTTSVMQSVATNIGIRK